MEAIDAKQREQEAAAAAKKEADKINVDAVVNKVVKENKVLKEDAIEVANENSIAEAAGNSIAAEKQAQSVDDEL